MATNPVSNYKYAIIDHAGRILERARGRRALYTTYKQDLKQYSERDKDYGCSARDKDHGCEIVELWFKRHNNNSVEK